ncbi:ABC transporter permease [Phenylobacterium sp.]|uniref:ABC transporter permease n=1 Tax=Phenylobacterium sp. TaxID=1871053 RepID=UPI002FCA871F
MGRVIRGLASVAITLFLLLLLTFVVTRMLPGDPVVAVVGETADPAVYARVRAEMGLDQPLPVQLVRYVAGFARGTLGVSTVTGNPVELDLLRVFPATFELATLAMVLSVLVGLPLGVLAALRQNTVLDYLVRLAGLIGFSTPIFWLGLMGVSLLYGEWGLLPGPGRVDPALILKTPEITGFLTLDAALSGDWTTAASAVHHMLMPALTLTVLGAAFLSRMTRAFLLEQLEQEYVTAARAKGVSGWRLVVRHPFRNTLVQLVTVIALGYAGLLEGSVLIEVVFAWPGLGLYLANAVLSGDVNAVVGGVLLVGVIFIVLNQLADWIGERIDPRLAA